MVLLRLISLPTYSKARLNALHRIHRTVWRMPAGSLLEKCIIGGRHRVYGRAAKCDRHIVSERERKRSGLIAVLSWKLPTQPIHVCRVCVCRPLASGLDSVCAWLCECVACIKLERAFFQSASNGSWTHRLQIRALMFISFACVRCTVLTMRSVHIIQPGICVVTGVIDSLA